MRFRLPLLAAAALSALVISVGGMASLAAHTEVFERSPAMGQAYGGVIDEVQISFWAAIESGEILIEGPNGQQVEVGETRLEQGNRIEVVEFPALVDAGAYVVTHTELAADGDTQTASYQFFYDPDSEREVEPLIGGDDGPNWPMLGIIAGVVLVLAGLFWPGRSSK